MKSLFLSDIFKYDNSRGWCEEDYITNTYIAEFWNTVSNIVLLILSFYGIYWHHKLHRKIQKSYIVCLMIAIGSAWYHATLSRIGQLADELPMLILCTMIANDLFSTTSNSHNWPKLHFITLTIAVIYAITDAYAIFILYFGTVVSVVLLIPLYMHKRYLQRVLYQKAIIMFIVGFTAWLIDIHACSQIIEHFYLHSWWHVCSGFALYWYVQFMMARHGRLHHSFPLEVVRIMI